MIILINLKLC